MAVERVRYRPVSTEDRRQALGAGRALIAGTAAALPLWLLALTVVTLLRHWMG